ncbi:MAG: sigma-70 family RNA polymerase sigma factor [Alcaligenes sp.]
MTTDDPHQHELVEVFLARRRDFRFIAYRIVGSSDHVDDVLQDAYIKLAVGVCAKNVKNPFGYCCQVVRNMALDHCRRRVVESGCFVSSPDGTLPNVEGGTPADAGIDERRLLERIGVALATLPPRTRLVFELYRLEGRTQREIAKMLGVSATLVNFMVRDVTEVLATCRDVMEN